MSKRWSIRCFVFVSLIFDDRKQRRMSQFRLRKFESSSKSKASGAERNISWYIPGTCQCLEHGEVPQQWKDTTIKILYKKKDRSDSNNYRGFACCPLRQSIAENGSVPPQQLLRGQEDTPRKAVRFSRSTFDNRHAVRCQKKRKS